MVIAQFNAGDYLQEIAANPVCENPPAREQICGHWERALELAHQLGLEDLSAEINLRLDRFCD
jgi:hypothetical protein